ncbi:MAG TPA: flagellar biosynthesis protein FlhF [Rhodocyclaceae bacterium]|nr:flagellar biosynthesis protein FlhF [Rhodocyclaceae bacterium]
MTVKRFVGASARECFRRVKEELGPDAIVISNKPLDDGSVEIVASSPESLDALSAQAHAPRGAALTSRMPSWAESPAGKHRAPPKPAAHPAPPPTEDDYTVTLSSKGALKPALVRPWTPYAINSAPAPAPAAPMAEPRASVRPAARKAAAPADFGAPGGRPGVRAATPRSDEYRETPLKEPASRAREGVRDAPRQATDPQVSPQVSQLMEEMRVIKSLLEHQLSGFAWGDMIKESPMKVQLLGEMIEAGFSGQLTRRLIQEMPENPNQSEGLKWMMAAVNRRLRTLPTESDFIDRGGVYALVGPTGVGKTTTTAKLAARCVVRYGAERLALMTTDNFRIGAHEQLRVYGRILGVPVFVVRDGEDLRRTLADLRDKHMVLIDTVGMSQRDRMVAEQAAMLTRSGEVNRLLLLNAGCRGDTLDDVIRAYSGEDLAGCILTKVDEATALAPALDCIIRHGLTLSYVANGQRVPEDLHLPNRNYILHRAFKVGAGETAHRLKPDELAMTYSMNKETREGASHA